MRREKHGGRAAMAGYQPDRAVIIDLGKPEAAVLLWNFQPKAAQLRQAFHDGIRNEPGPVNRVCVNIRFYEIFEFLQELVADFFIIRLLVRIREHEIPAHVAGKKISNKARVFPGSLSRLFGDFQRFGFFFVLNEIHESGEGLLKTWPCLDSLEPSDYVL